MSSTVPAIFGTRESEPRIHESAKTSFAVMRRAGSTSNMRFTSEMAGGVMYFQEDEVKDNGVLHKA